MKESLFRKPLVAETEPDQLGCFVVGEVTTFEQLAHVFWTDRVIPMHPVRNRIVSDAQDVGKDVMRPLSQVKEPLPECSKVREDIFVHRSTPVEYHSTT